MRTLKRFLKDEKGLETVEWTILAALIILGVVALVGSLQTEIGNVFTGLATEMQTALLP
ncbi:MAG: Flp family type IVb pilin [Planctomycetota bacterium]|jgi:Flp pilus assembly pilin Flp